MFSKHVKTGDPVYDIIVPANSAETAPVSRYRVMLQQMLIFCRLLRMSGIRVAPEQVTDACRSLTFIDLSNVDDFRQTLRTNLVRRYQDLDVFDEVFYRFWWASDEAEAKPAADEEERAMPVHVDDSSAGPPSSITSDEAEPAGAVKRMPLPAENVSGESSLPKALKQTGTMDADETTLLPLASDQEIWRQKDFRTYALDELEQVGPMIARIVLPLRRHPRRRRKMSGRGREFDFRRTWRRSLRYGGEVIEWIGHRRKQRPRKLVVLADVSGSMDPYNIFLLQFTYSLQSKIRDVESFVFSTNLTCITRELLKGGFNAALQAASARAQHWSGGTTIGRCLRVFNEGYGRTLALNQWDSVRSLGYVLQELFTGSCRPVERTGVSGPVEPGRAL